MSHRTKARSHGGDIKNKPIIKVTGTILSTATKMTVQPKKPTKKSLPHLVDIFIKKNNNKK